MTTDWRMPFTPRADLAGPIDYNDFELVDEILMVKSSLIDLINKSTGKPLALTSIRSLFCLENLVYMNILDYRKNR